MQNRIREAAHVQHCTIDVSARRTTSSLPSAARDALTRLEHAFAPAPAQLMSFPVSGGAVTVTADGPSPMPYRWQCPAGHGGDPYASLPFCRDDARKHAAECPVLTAAVTAYHTAKARYAELLAINPVYLTDDQDKELCKSRHAMGDAYQVLHDADKLYLLRPVTAGEATASRTPESIRRRDRRTLGLNIGPKADWTVRV